MIEIVQVTCIWDAIKEKETFEEFIEKNPETKVTNIHNNKITTESYVIYETQEERKDV